MNLIPSRVLLFISLNSNYVYVGKHMGEIILTVLVRKDY